METSDALPTMGFATAQQWLQWAEDFKEERAELKTTETCAGCGGEFTDTVCWDCWDFYNAPTEEQRRKWADDFDERHGNPTDAETEKALDDLDYVAREAHMIDEDECPKCHILCGLCRITDDEAQCFSCGHVIYGRLAALVPWWNEPR